MSRKSVTSRPSDCLVLPVWSADFFDAALRAMELSTSALRPLPVLEEFLGRNQNRDLARLRLDKMRERKHASIDDRGDDGDHAEKTYQARHCVSCFRSDRRRSLRRTFSRTSTRRSESKAHWQIHYRSMIRASVFGL